MRVVAEEEKHKDYRPDYNADYTDRALSSTVHWGDPASSICLPNLEVLIVQLVGPRLRAVFTS